LRQRHLGEHGDELLGAGATVQARRRGRSGEAVRGLCHCRRAGTSAVHATIQAATPLPASKPWPSRQPSGRPARTRSRNRS